MNKYIDLTFIILFATWFKFLSLFKRNRKGILIIQIVAIGDIINSSSFYRHLKDIGISKITVVCRRKYYEVYNKYNPYVDEWILFDESYTNIIGKFKFFHKLYKYNVQITFDLTGSYFSKWLGWSTGSKTYGIDLRRSGFNWLYTRYIKDPSERMHMVDAYFNLLPYLTPASNRSLEFWGMTTYRPRIFNKYYNIISIGIGGNVESRQWTDDGFAKVIHYILSRGYKVVLLGDKNDIAKAKRIKRIVKCNRMIYDFTGKTTIGEVGYVIHRSKLLVSNDCGLVHIGAAVDTPTVAIFGPASSVQWGPYNDNSRVVRQGNCVPCSSTPMCDDPICLTQLNPDYVINAIGELL